MKKTKRTAVIVILAVVALLTSVLTFTLLISAENAAEATLTVETITRNSSGYEDEGKTKKVSTETGSYQTLLTKLASLDPEVDTRYTLKLSADAVQTAPVNLNIGAMAEVCIDLGGYKLSSALADAAITVSGSGKFRVNGNYTSLGECGQLVLSGAGEFVSIAADSTVFADIKNLDATYLGDYYLTAFGGEITLRESYVTYAGSESGAVVYAEGATANLKYVDVTAIDATSVLYLSGAKGYIEGGYAYAGTLVESDDKASYALLASVDAETVIAFKIGSLDTKTYVLGGKIDISAALVAGQATADTLVFYYGDGTMKLSGAGADPTGYGVQTHCSFAEVDDDVYVMSTSSTATAMSTTATLGEAPVVATHSSYIKGMGADGISRAIKKTVTAPTVGINVILKDTSVTPSNFAINGSEYTSIIVGLNGHTLTATNKTGNFNYSGNIHYTLEGAGVDGNRGGMVSQSAHFMFLYPRQASSTGVNNEHTVTRITDVDFTVTDMGSAGGDALININSGDIIMEDCTVTYDGTTLSDSTTGTTFTMFVFDHSYGPLVNAHLKNVTVKDTYEGERVMNMTAFGVRERARVFCNNVTIDGPYLAASGSTTNSITFIDSKITVAEQAFSGNVAHLYDTAVVVPTGKLSSTSAGTVYIHPTDKCATTISTGSNTLLGKYEITKEGFAMYPTAGNVYELTDGIDSPEPITLPKIFANGMVFQRGKTINVFGYCPDTDAELKVTLGDRVGTCKVDENGEFYCELAPLPASWGLTLTIEQTNHMLENKVIFTDVAVGEVWVMSGQSNAQLQSGYLEDVAELAVLADTVKNVRTYKSTASFTLNPSKYGSGSWDTTVNSSNMKSTSSSAVSAVGLAAVFRLAAELGPDVPVALVHAARGGSPIAGWLDYETLKELSPSKAAEYEKFCKDNANASTLPDSGRTTIGCCLYNHQIAPYEGFEVAGVMWYQGCSDSAGTKLGTEGKTYTDYFKALERVYRRVFGNDNQLPFYVMQLAPYHDVIDELSGFKVEQFDFCRELDDTYLVSIANEGAIWSPNQFSQGHIHPTRKSPVANRTADAILANEYGIKYNDAFSHPDVVSLSASGSTVTVNFDTDLKLFFGVAPVGFELSSDGKTWVKAEGRIEGKSVILTSSVGSPKYVRYGYSLFHAELADGTMVAINSMSFNGDNKVITIKSGDASYTIDDATDLIRTMNYGNITNASGVPMPTFKLPVSN